jgi:hypothetical protein
MIETDIGDDCKNRLKDVGSVKSSPEAGLNDRYFDTRPGKVVEPERSD